MQEVNIHIILKSIAKTYSDGLLLNDYLCSLDLLHLDMLYNCLDVFLVIPSFLLELDFYQIIFNFSEEKFRQGVSRDTKKGYKYKEYSMTLYPSISLRLIYQFY